VDSISRSSKKIESTVFLFILILLFALSAVFIFFPDYDSPRMLKFLILCQIMFVLSIMIYLVGRRYDFDMKDKRLFLVIVILAICIRIIILFGSGETYYFSDDVYRYIWDGRVNADGINPFMYSPLADEVEHLKDSIIHPNINYPFMPTIYPPMAQNIFYLAQLIDNTGTFGFKLISAVFELLTFFALFVWLRVTGVPRGNLLLYMFSPLILIEFLISAHLDILAMPFLITSLITIRKRQPLVTAILLASASLVKFYGLFFVPIVLFHFKGRQRWIFLLSFICTFILLYLPYVRDCGISVLGSLPTYLKVWHYYASFYDVLILMIDASIARYITLGLFAVVIMAILFLRINIYQKMFIVFGSYIILTPTIFPWYLVWIFPFMIRNLSPAFWYLSGSILLSYNVFISVHTNVPWEGEWNEIWYLKLICYIPFYLLLISVPLWNYFKKVRSA
jgi:hypothetical protein